MRKNDKAEMADVTYVGKSVVVFRTKRKDYTGIAM